MKGITVTSERGLGSSVAMALLGACLILTVLVTLPARALAATRCFTIGTANTPVYSSTSLSSRIGAVYASDEVQVNGFSSDKAAVNVTYPTSRGSKSGWIRTSAILSATGGYGYNSKGRFATYRRPGGASYGSVYTNDQVVVLGSNGSWTQIRYPVSGGYKFAWAQTSTVTANTTGSGTNSQTTSATAAVQQRLDQIASGSLSYDSRTVMRLGSKFTGARANEQCKGFGKNVFYLCFKITPSSTQSKPNNYLLNSTGGMTRVGYYSNITADRARSLFSKARPGDFVQMRRRSSGGSHSAIVYSVSSSGITFFEANTDGRNTVTRSSYTWAQLASRNSGMSLYTASNYGLR